MRTRPDILTEIELPSGPVTIDEHGYITDPDAWSLDFADHAAAQEGIVLGPEHREIIKFLRDFLDSHGVAADARFVLKYISDRDNLDKSGAKDVYFGLFPKGHVKQACKIAGMKQPRAWSTG